MHELPLQHTSQEIWGKKYQLYDAHDRPVDKTIDDTYLRVAKALASIEENPEKWVDQFYKALKEGATPAGRIMSNAGAEEHKPATSLINCLAGDTPVLTREGIVSIKDLAGEDVEILNGNGEWTTAPFKSFGEQDTFKVTLRWGNNKKTKKEVYATKDHRWFLSDGRVVTTEFWMTGGLNNKTRSIPHLFVPQEELVDSEYDEGLIHGMVYGDGSSVSTENKFFLNLCGEKRQMTNMVGDILQTSPSEYEDTTRFTVESTKNLKAVPSDYTFSYLKGFIAGVLATDGSVYKNSNGCEVVLYGDKDLVDFINTHSAFCGVIPTYTRKSAGRGEITNYGERNKDLWAVGLHPSTVDPKDVHRDLHKKHLKTTTGGAKSKNRWLVESVDTTPVRQEVFCCHEYETTAFCLFNGMKTGQCTVSQIVEDSMSGVLDSNMQAGLTLKAGCGIGYEFSTLRPKGAYVGGAGAYTSGPLTFMDIFDKMCFTVSSAGGRRGAQMGTFAVWHPDVEEFISVKREDGRLRQFNLSLLIDDEFMESVKTDSDYKLVFPIKSSEVEKGLITDDVETVWKNRFWSTDYCRSQGYIINDDDEIYCKVYKTVEGRELWNTIMESTYDFSEPGFLLIDRINQYNNNWFCEEIRATNPCGEQPLPPEGSCLLGSVNVAKFVDNPFTAQATFNWDRYKETVRIFTRMLDNVVELNGLPLEGQRREIEYKRRHGMGFLGLGSALSLLGKQYGDEWSVKFTEELMKVMAVEGFKVGVDLAKEKGSAPIFRDTTDGKSNIDLWCDGEYMKRIWSVDPELEKEARTHGCRFTHHTSIAPTGTISLSLNNNVSNGIEPSFSHHYIRNVVTEGKKSKASVDVFSYEMLLYKEITGEETVPEFFSTSENVSTYAHVDIQAAAQKWCDSSISKTINAPTDTSFESFKDIYLYAYDHGLKGCTTFRMNPEAFQGVLVRDEDLEKIDYVFVLEDGTEIKTKGTDMINYDGEEHKAANLFDAIKEGYYGKF